MYLAKRTNYLFGKAQDSGLNVEDVYGIAKAEISKEHEKLQAENLHMLKWTCRVKKSSFAH